MSTQKNPYIGPRTYQRNEGHLFFGREREARDLIALVASERLVVFYAQSGAGKSSIVNTRLIPNLEEKEYEVLPVGRVSGDIGEGLEVSNIYVYNLSRSLEQHDVDSASLARLSLAQFLSQLNFDDKGFFYDANLPDSIPAGEDETVIRRALIIDQFEELFSTHPEAWEKREDFFVQVSQAMQDDPHLWVVLVMREDYIAALDPYAHLVMNGLRVRYYMQRLGREAALKAVKSPVEGIRPYAEGVAEKLIDDLCSIKVQQPDGTLDVQPGQYVEPVQMQVVCYGLWDNLSVDGTEISEKDLQDVGDVNQSLGKYYDRRIAEVARAKNVRERLIREWFEKKLITAGGIRNMVLQERETKQGELADDVIRALQSDLVRSEKRGGATWYELTHDRLVEPILERNKVWFSENLSPLQRQAALWKDQDQNESWLLGDQALIEVEEWAETHSDDLTEVEREFLEACRIRQTEQKEKQDREAQRKELESTRKLMDEQARSARIARWFSLVAGFLLVLALIATGLAVSSSRKANDNAEKLEIASTQISQGADEAKRQEKIARSSELSTIGLVLSDDQLDLSLLLGIEADSINPSSKTQRTLINLLQKAAAYRGTIQGDEEVLDIQFSPDGKLFASRSSNGIMLWNANTLKPLADHPLNGHYAGITALAVSQDGKIMASGGADGTFVLWDALSRQKLNQPFKAGKGSISSLAFSPDGNILASASSNELTVNLWDISDRTSPRQIGKSLSKHQSAVLSIAFSPDGKALATGSYDRTVVLWDIKDANNPQATGRTPEQGDWVNKVAFLNRNGDILVSASDDSKVVLWNVKDLTKPLKLSESSNETGAYVRGLAVSPDDQTVASGNMDGSIILWNIKDPTQQPEKIGILNKNNEGSNPVLLAFSDEKTLVSSTYGGAVVLWDIDSRQAINQALGGSSPSTVMVLKPNGNTVMIGSSDSTISYWDISDPEKPHKAGDLLQEGHPGQPTGMQFSPDGSLLASFGDDATVLFDTKTQEQIGVGSISGTSLDGNLLAYETLDRTTGERSVHIKNTIAGDEVLKPIPGQNPVFSTDGKKLTLQTDQPDGTSRLHIWDISNKEELVSPGPGNSPFFSPDGAILVYQTTDQNINHINLWNIAEKTNIAQDLVGGSPMISPDGNTLLYQTTTASGDPAIRLWDITKRQDLKEIPGSILSISQNNKVLVFQSYDASSGITSINILDTSTGNTPIEPIGGAAFLAIGSDGRILVYQLDNKINVFDTQENRPTVDPFEGSFRSLLLGGKILIYDSLDGKPTLLDTTGQNQVTPIPGTYRAIAPDGQVLVYGSFENNNNTLRLWDITKNQNIGMPIKESYGSFFAISPNGKTLVTKNEKNAVMVWDAARTWPLGEPLGEKNNDVSSAVISPDGKSLAWIGKEGVALQEVEDGAVLGEPFNDHFDSTFQGSYPSLSPDGRFLAIGNYNTSSTTLWKLNALESIDMEFPGSWPLFSPDGKLLAIGDFNKSTTTIWDLSTKEQGSAFPGSYFSFSPDGKLLAVGDNNTSTTKLWDLTTRKQVGKDFQGIWPLFSPDGRQLALGDYKISITTVWDWAAHKQIGTGFPGFIPSFSPDGELLAVGSNSSTKVWEFKTLGEVNNFSGTWPSFSPNRRLRLLAVGDYATSTTKLWDLNTGKQLGKDFPSNAPSFSFDGRYLAVGSESTMKTSLWDLNNMEQPSQITSKLTIPATGLVFSTDGKTLATLAADGIVLRNLDTDATHPLESAENYVHIPANRMSFYADDTRFAAIGDDGSLTTWDAESGAITVPNESDHHFEIDTSLPAFSPDGKYLIYAENSSLHVWDVVKNEQYHGSVTGIDTLAPNDVRIAFSPDGRIMALGDNEKVDLYNLPQLSKMEGEFSTYFLMNGLNLVMDNEKVKYVVTLDTLGNSQIWDWETQTKIGDPMPGNLRFIASVPQDHTVLYIDPGGKLIKFKWDLDHEAWKNLLCPLAKRNLSQAEQLQYFPGEDYRTICPQ